MDWFYKTYEKLTKDELYVLLRFRAEVFIMEQGPYQDLDNKDQKAIHIFAVDGDEIIAYARIFRAGDYFKEASIGRVATKFSIRRTGLGKKLMEKSIAYINIHFNTKTIHISAQKRLKKYYESLGFQQIGAGYLEDGIPHIGMLRI